MNEQHAEKRQAKGTQRQGGYVVLGQRAVPEAVLAGRALRALADSQQGDAPVEGADQIRCLLGGFEPLVKVMSYVLD